MATLLLTSQPAIAVGEAPGVAIVVGLAALGGTCLVAVESGTAAHLLFERARDDGRSVLSGWRDRILYFGSGGTVRFVAGRDALRGPNLTAALVSDDSLVDAARMCMRIDLPITGRR